MNLEHETHIVVQNNYINVETVLTQCVAPCSLTQLSTEHKNRGELVWDKVWLQLLYTNSFFTPFSFIYVHVHV